MEKEMPTGFAKRICTIAEQMNLCQKPVGHGVSQVDTLLELVGF